MQTNYLIDLIEFAKKAYKNHDKAHDLNHALRVFNNSLKIIESEGIHLDDTERRLLPYIMIGHDFCDHKIVNGLTKDEIRQFYESRLGSLAEEVIHIHDNCSWSKRRSSKPLNNSRDWMRKVLQDADWFEAIGEIGLQRCIEYSKSINGTTADICTHIREKLLLIPAELNYDSSKEMALGKLEPLYKYLEQNEL
ncbi:HD hydrolase [Pacmanvirus A23]|uniref:HD hydrolase n=1 Tax=Pacmanvirus A23 TaxID=1932881 RepID=UPI000A092B5D|nr:HD hydrolase [Pacmanvirus A23]SIP86171.1 HD hydrolase [Pacmanvirus A23]